MYLRDYDWINIHAIIDIHHDALAFLLAKELGIRTSTNRHSILNDCIGGIVLMSRVTMQWQQSLLQCLSLKRMN